MNYCEIKYFDIANGPGVRTSLFVSGCTHHCKGCFNEMAWDFNSGKEYTTDVEGEIISSLSPAFIIYDTSVKSIKIRLGLACRRIYQKRV